MFQTRKLVIATAFMGAMSSMNISYAAPGIVTVYLEPESCTLQVWCDKDISNIAFLRGDEFHKNENLTGHHYTMDANGIDTIWVKCGNNHKPGQKNKGLGEMFSGFNTDENCGDIEPPD